MWEGLQPDYVTDVTKIRKSLLRETYQEGNVERCTPGVGVDVDMDMDMGELIGEIGSRDLSLPAEDIAANQTKSQVFWFMINHSHLQYVAYVIT